VIASDVSFTAKFVFLLSIFFFFVLCAQKDGEGLKLKEKEIKRLVNEVNGRGRNIISLLRSLMMKIFVFISFQFDQVSREQVKKLCVSFLFLFFIIVFVQKKE
jgi:hypothetical protein